MAVLWYGNGNSSPKEYRKEVKRLINLILLLILSSCLTTKKIGGNDNSIYLIPVLKRIYESDSLLSSQWPPLSRLEHACIDGNASKAIREFGIKHYHVFLSDSMLLFQKAKSKSGIEGIILYAHDKFNWYALGFLFDNKSFTHTMAKLFECTEDTLTLQTNRSCKHQKTSHLIYFLDEMTSCLTFEIYEYSPPIINDSLNAPIIFSVTPNATRFVKKCN